MTKRRQLYASVCVLCALSGCSSMPNSVSVRVPVAVPCIAEVPAKPPFRSDAELAALPDDALIIGLASDRRSRQAYEATLEATIAGCV